MEECRWNGISFNLENYAFCVNLGVPLGHIVCSHGLLVDPEKILQSLQCQYQLMWQKQKDFWEQLVSIDVIFETLITKQHLCANY